MTVFEVTVRRSAGGHSLVLTIMAKDAAGALRRTRKWYPGCLFSVPEPCCPYGDPECPALGTPLWECCHLECSAPKPDRQTFSRAKEAPEFDYPRCKFCGRPKLAYRWHQNEPVCEDCSVRDASAADQVEQGLG